MLRINEQTGLLHSYRHSPESDWILDGQCAGKRWGICRRQAPGTSVPHRPSTTSHIIKSREGMFIKTSPVSSPKMRIIFIHSMVPIKSPQSIYIYKIEYSCIIIRTPPPSKLLQTKMAASIAKYTCH
jgi:hypothetical protein